MNHDIITKAPSMGEYDAATEALQLAGINRICGLPLYMRMDMSWVKDERALVVMAAKVLESSRKLEQALARAERAEAECSAWMDDAMDLREALDKANGKGTAAAVEATAELHQRKLEQALARAERAEDAARDGKSTQVATDCYRLARAEGKP